MAEFTPIPVEEEAPIKADITVVVPKEAKPFEPIPVEPEVFTPIEIGEAPEVSSIEALQYGFESTPSDVFNGALWLESRFPIGEFSLFNEQGEFDPEYLSPEELHGTEFMQADPETRRQFLVDKRNAHLREKYGADVADSQSAAKFLGSLGGALASPTTVAIPMGQSYKTIALTSALIGAEYDALNQLANTGEVDAEQTATTAALSAVAGPVATYGLRQIGQAGSKTISAIKDTVAKRSADKAARNSANEQMGRINSAIGEAVAQRVPEEQIPAYVQDKLDLDEATYRTVIANSDTPIKIPTPEEAQLLSEIKLFNTDPIGMRKVFEWADTLIGGMRQRVKEISPRIAQRLDEFELLSHQRASEYMNRVTPFMKDLSKLPKRVQRTATQHLLNGDYDNVVTILNQYRPQAVQNFNQVQDVLDELFKALQKAEFDVVQIPNYWPRVVKDVKKLRAKLSDDQNSMIERAWKDRAKQLGLKSVADLPEEDKITIVNGIVRGYMPRITEGGMSFVKSRAIDKVTDDLLEDYMTASQSLTSYIRNVVHQIEKRRFLGTASVKKGMQGINVDESVGQFVTQEAGKLSADAQDELVRLLTARFGMGEKTPARIIQDIRNTGYMATIGNPISALVQLKDIGISAYYNGLRNTIANMFGRNIKASDLGLDDKIAQEFVSTSTTAQALNGLFKITGFRAIDQFGKGVFIRASLAKGQQMVKSSKGLAKLRAKYGAAFGDEFDLLVADLQAGKITPNVKLYLWTELANVQPISLSNMPLPYLNNPNGRVFYALKTFAIQQLNMLRDDVVNQWKIGNKSQATKNALSYAMLVSLAGASVDQVRGMLLGKGYRPEDISDDMIENLLGVFLLSKYDVENRLSEGSVGEFLTDKILGLPTPDFFDRGSRDLITLMTSGELEESEVAKNFPGMGQLFYYWFGGGIEDFEKKKLKEKREEQLKSLKLPE